RVHAQISRLLMKIRNGDFDLLFHGQGSIESNYLLPIPELGDNGLRLHFPGGFLSLPSSRE
ncbi:MAG: hypothetical protein KDA83_19990, partial [Planctomycetales bacterium]|nr:hypothetical protein [Planctomycetales bacterium]